MINGIRNNSIIKSSGRGSVLPTLQLKSTGGLGQRFWYLNGNEIMSGNENKVLRYCFKRTGQFQIMVLIVAGILRW